MVRFIKFERSSAGKKKDMKKVILCSGKIYFDLIEAREKLKRDNVVSDNALGFSKLGIRAESMESIIGGYLLRYRKYGQFHKKSN